MTRKIELLCEGFLGEFVPTAAYVRQGDKVCFLIGRPDGLSESLTGVTIVESVDALEMVERQVGSGTVKVVKDGRMFVECPCQRSGVKNANGRTYGRGIWERLVARPDSDVQQRVKDGAMLGVLEHPADGRTSGKEGALLTRRLKLVEDGTVDGRFELLDTPNGLILQEYTLKGVKWGVSTQGRGAVDDKGNVDEASYMLDTIDAVMSPSTPGAHPKPANENRDTVSKFSEEEIHDFDAALSVTDEALDPQERTAFIHGMIRRLGRASALGADATAASYRDRIVKVLDAVSQKATGEFSEGFDTLLEGATTALGKARVKETGGGYRMTLSANDTHNWAHRPGREWPNSSLAGKPVRVEVDGNGIVDGNKHALSASGDELEAIVGDHLPDHLRKHWPTWGRTKASESVADGRLERAGQALRELRAENESLQGQVTLLTSQSGQLRQRLQESIRQARTLREQLAVAEAALTEPEETPDTAVSLAIGEAMRKNPRLEAYAATLAEAKAPEELDQAVALLEGKTAGEPGDRRVRHLPVMGRVESAPGALVESTASSPVSEETGSRTSLAAMAVKKLGIKKA